KQLVHRAVRSRADVKILEKPGVLLTDVLNSAALLIGVPGTAPHEPTALGRVVTPVLLSRILRKPLGGKSRHEGETMRNRWSQFGHTPAPVFLGLLEMPAQKRRVAPARVFQVEPVFLGITGFLVQDGRQDFDEDPIGMNPVCQKMTKDKELSKRTATE